MQIHNDGLSGSTPLETGRTQSGALAANGGLTGRTAAGHDGDSVEISGISSHVAQANAADGAQREQRVAELAALHARGQYQPQAAQLSRALVSHALAQGEAK